MNLGSTQLQWQQDTAVLSLLRTNWNDKLEVTKGRLQLEKGERQRKVGESITPDALVLLDRLRELIRDVADKCFKSIKESHSNTPEFYEQIADFNRQFKGLYKGIGHIMDTFKPNDCNNQRFFNLYQELLKSTEESLNELKNYKSKLTKPNLNQRPIKHIDYDERIGPRSISWSYPERVPLAETVAAAKKALLFAQSQQKTQSIYIKCIKSLMCLGLLAQGVLIVAPLSVLKIVFWNPLEWLFRGEVRTNGLFSQYLQEWRSLDENIHMIAYQRYTNQLLHCPIITEEVAGAFKELAAEAYLLDLGDVNLFSEDITELAPFIQEDKRCGAISIAGFLKTLKEYCENNKKVLQTLDRVEQLYKLINKTDREDSSESIKEFLDRCFSRNKKNNLDFLEPHSAFPFISPKVLHKLLETARSSSTCREIRLPKSVLKEGFVRDFLKQNSYRLRVEGKDKITYRRYSMI